MAITSLLDQFPRQRVLVVGDVILDHYIRGAVSRTSPEAPVPILAVEGEEYLPGGAANVAMNVVSMGGRVDLVGLAAKDPSGKTLRELLGEIPGLKAVLVEEKGLPTIEKTRCMAQGQQMLRLDKEVVRPPSAGTVEQLKKRISSLMDKATGVILSDYGKGLLQPELISWIVTESHRRGLKVVTDPKGRDYSRYRGVDMLTPNQKEASDASGVTVVDEATSAEAARLIQKSVRANALVITKGPSGVSVYPKGRPSRHIPARAREVFDVTGAGDSFIAAMGMALFGGASFAEAAEVGNLAGGIAVGHVGVVSVSLQALRSAASGQARRSKEVTVEDLVQAIRSHRHHGHRVVFTNGFFDLLHHGHVRLLEKARTLGDCLVLALNSDACTKRLKGAPRPILRIRERVELLSALPFVDYIVVFDEDTPEALLRRIKPDVLVKGGAAGDSVECAVGHDIVTGYGGEVSLVNVEEASTISAILARATEK